VSLPTLLTRGAALVGIAALGGLAALTGVAVTGNLGGGTTTVVERAPASVDAAPAVSGDGMSIAEIYDRAAPGVVRSPRRPVSAKGSGVSRATSPRRTRSRRSGPAS